MREWVTCKVCSGEWSEGEGYDECPYCAKAAAQSRREAAEEWRDECWRQDMIDRRREERESIGIDRRESDYWDEKRGLV